MYKRQHGQSVRYQAGVEYVTQGVESILQSVASATQDPALSKSVYFGPTALTHIRRLIETGGSIITDTMLVANDIDDKLLGNNGAQILCFIDDPQVVTLAEQRHAGQTDKAGRPYIDHPRRVAGRLDTPEARCLAVAGPKLMVIGSAPAAINRILTRRQHEPMSDVCVLAAPTGFASVVQMKERLMDSDMNSIVVRGKKGGVNVTVALVNAILRQIAETADR